MRRVINGIRVDVEADRQRASHGEMCGEIVNCDNKKCGGGGGEKKIKKKKEPHKI